jgi:hypothetical protein
MSDETSVPDEPLTGETHGDPNPPLRGADPEILDEDPLLEEQPYAVLEENDDDFPLAGLDSSSGGGSW